MGFVSRLCRYSSSPSRKTSVRKPSHLGSYCQPSPVGSGPGLESIGSSGGANGSFMGMREGVPAGRRDVFQGDSAPGRLAPPPMIVHLIDGTYELFRHFYGIRRFRKGEDPPLGAVAGVLHTVLQTIEGGGTHVGVATDHVIE